MNTPQPASPRVVSQEEYNAFIRQIELQQIWLVSATLKNPLGPDTPPNATVTVSGSSRWTPSDGGFDAFTAYTVGVALPESADGLAVAVEFGLRFRSATPLTDDLFHVFSRVNLPVNSWPYLREYVATSIGRLGWLPFTLPALKREPKPAQAGSSPG